MAANNQLPGSRGGSLNNSLPAWDHPGVPVEGEVSGPYFMRGD